MTPLPAIAFLTRLPVPGQQNRTLSDVSRSQAWFAAVGLLIGGGLVGIDRLAMQALPGSAVDVLLVVTLVLVTGALHLDGLADAADGIFGGATKGQRLEIMRDVHAGTYAVLAIVCVLGLKWAGLTALPSNVRIEALLLTPCLARLAMCISIAAFPYAREEGLGVDFRRHAWPLSLGVCGVTAAASAIMLFGIPGIMLAGIAAASAVTVGAVSLIKVGGMTGDLYGATVEITEAVLLLSIAALARHDLLDAWVLA